MEADEVNVIFRQIGISFLQFAQQIFVLVLHILLKAIPKSFIDNVLTEQFEEILYKVRLVGDVFGLEQILIDCVDYTLDAVDCATHRGLQVACRQFAVHFSEHLGRMLKFRLQLLVLYGNYMIPA